MPGLMQDQWNHKMFNQAAGNFDSLALEAFRYQYADNPVYRQYADALNRNPGSVATTEQIPFLPISFFKTHAIKSGSFETQHIFESSGTTGSINSRHFIRDIRLYEESFMKTFELFYGPVNNWCIIGLLPSYLERNNSSLVYMVNALTRESGHPRSGFYLDDLRKLASNLDQLESAGQKVLLIGVTYALLDFARQYPRRLERTIVMETGGMKGRQKEMTRAELYTELRLAFGLSEIHSEYGMTELLSQAYARNGIFRTPPWMKVLLRDETDPFSLKTKGTGAVNVIDLANIYSCSFIATEDVGRISGQAGFEILGRMDHSDIRGCSLMAI